jgi:tetratricopeptide (TPR) repeat protein
MKFFHIILFSFIILISGCSTKVTVKGISPGQVNDSTIKNITILDFKNDNISQAREIESALSNLTVEGEKYFNVINREHLNEVIKENSLNSSGIVNSSNDFEGLEEAESFLTGSVEISDVSKVFYREYRTDYSSCVLYAKNKDGKEYCKEYRRYTVRCQKNLYTLNTKVKIIKVKNSTTLFSKNYLKRKRLKSCYDDPNDLPSVEVVNSELARLIANDVITDIAPHYVYYRVVLLDDEDIKYSEKESNMLQNSLELIKNKRIEKANELLKRLNNSLNAKSYVALYNLGVTEEALGNLQKAYDLYEKAENITLLSSSVDEVSNAVQRIKIELQKQKKAKAQISN